MALLEIQVDLNRVAKALERIADAADRAFPNITITHDPTISGPEDLTLATDESLWKAEEEEAAKREAGLAPEPES